MNTTDTHHKPKYVTLFEMYVCVKMTEISLDTKDAILSL